MVSKVCAIALSFVLLVVAQHGCSCTCSILSDLGLTTTVPCPKKDAIIYAASGNGALLTGPDDEQSEPKRHQLGKGDFVFVPAWTEHQALNESEDEDLVWVVIRSGPQPVEVSLTDWGGPEAKVEVNRR